MCLADAAEPIVVVIVVVDIVGACPGTRATGDNSIVGCAKFPDNTKTIAPLLGKFSRLPQKISALYLKKA